MSNPTKTITGGAYIPPAKLKILQDKISDKSSEEYQRLAWDALKKTLNGLLNKINKDNFDIIVKKVLSENIVRGRGILARTIIVNQDTSPVLTDVYAAFVAAINTKFPHIGLLIIKRLLNDFQKAYKRNDKKRALTCCRFFAHLVNQYVIDEIIMLELVTLFLQNPTNFSVEIAIGLMKECGARLEEISKAGSLSIFDRLRFLLNEGNLDKRVLYMIEVLFQIRKDKYQDFPPIRQGLDIVDEEDRTTHYLDLLDQVNTEDYLNVFKYDENYLENEAKYEQMKESLIGDSEGDDEDENDEENDETKPETKKTEQATMVIEDHTFIPQEQLRKKIYLTIQSSLTASEAVHKLVQIPLNEKQYYEMASMVFDYCAQLRMFEPRVSDMAQILCEYNKKYIAEFEKLFCENYPVMHRMEVAKITNIACFFARLLVSDTLSWGIFTVVELREDKTTSSGRIFLKYLFKEMRDMMGEEDLAERFKDEQMALFYQNIFPRDNLADTRFAINFFIAIEMGKLTKDLRKYYEETKEKKKQQALKKASKQKRKESFGDDSSESDSCDSSSSSSSSSESEEVEKTMNIVRQRHNENSNKKDERSYQGEGERRNMLRPTKESDRNKSPDYKDSVPNDKIPMRNKSPKDKNSHVRNRPISAKNTDVNHRSYKRTYSRSRSPGYKHSMIRNRPYENSSYTRKRSNERRNKFEGTECRSRKHSRSTDRRNKFEETECRSRRHSRSPRKDTHKHRK